MDIRKLIDLVETMNTDVLSEKIVHRDTTRLNPDDWLNTVVAINPTKSEFWSANFRQGKEGLQNSPDAAGVIFKDGTVVVGTGHSLSHEDICIHAGLDIDNEWVRLQIFNGEVRVEIWIEEDMASSNDPKDKIIAAAEEKTGMTIDQIKQKVGSLTSRFVPGWKVICMLWTEYSNYIEV